jgi:hypothetical protein
MLDPKIQWDRQLVIPDNVKAFPGHYPVRADRESW